MQEIVEPSGIIQGASYADAHARMPAALALMLASVVAAGLSVATALGRSNRHVITGAALYAVVLLGGEGYASVLQRFVVTPNEQVRETPFMEYNIAATRDAFALDLVEERELRGEASLSKQDIENNRGTLENVRLWDHQPLLETFGQIQEIRTYYDFMSVDNDRYQINGQNRQVMLSVRELNPAALPNRTWVNERLVFTHGHGLTLGPVNQVTSEGLPVLFVRDLPPVTTVDLQITEPSIYFGELVNDYVIVRTRAQEFHYPKGEDNVYTQYAGTGGVPLGSFWRKLLFAARFRNYQILLSDDITSESRLMFDRQIRRRVAKIAPFLVLDEDPYPVVSDGRIFWIQDAYTVTDRYPYSSSSAGVNYMRNSVKVVIDAYQGSVTFYAADTRDPIAQTLAKIFPNLMRPLAEMPEDLRRHVRYPEDIFGIQAAGVCDVSHDQSGGLLQQGRPMGGARRRQRRREPAHVAVLHDDEAAGRTDRGVHPDAAVHAAPARQPRVVDGREKRRRALRQAAGLPVPEADARIRATASRRPHQPGPGHLAADHVVEPAGLAGDPGHADGDSDRGIAHLRAAALSARAGGPDPGTDQGHRRLSEPHRHGADTRSGDRAAVRPERSPDGGEDRGHH